MAGTASLACLLQAPVRQGYVGPYRYGRMRTGTLRRASGKPPDYRFPASRTQIKPRSRLQPATLGTNTRA